MKMFTPSAYAYTCNYTYLGGRQIIFFLAASKLFGGHHYIQVCMVAFKIFNECHMRRPAARYMQLVGTI